MASGDGTSDGLGREQHPRTKNLGKAPQENKRNAALESKSGPEKNQNPKILSTQNVTQNHVLSKGKQVVQDFKYGHDSIDPNKQSSTSKPIRSFQDGSDIFPSRRDEERIIALGPSSSSKRSLIQPRQEVDFQTDGPDSSHSNREGAAASVAPTGAIAVEPNAGSIVAHLGEASLEPNGGALVVLNDVDRAKPFVRSIDAPHGRPPAQPNVALIVAPPGEVLTQPNIAQNVYGVAPPAHGVAPVQPDVAPHAQQIGAPAQPNVALIVVPPGVARAQPNAALIVAPPAVVVLDVNCGLNRSRLKPLQICEIGSEGHFWPKLPRN